MKTLTGLLPGRVQPQADFSRLPLVPGRPVLPLDQCQPPGAYSDSACAAGVSTSGCVCVGGERGRRHGMAPSEDTAALAAAPVLKGRHAGTLGGGARPGCVSRTAPHQTGGTSPRWSPSPRSRSDSGTVVGGGGVGGEESQGRLTDKEMEGPGSQPTRGEA